MYRMIPSTLKNNLFTDKLSSVGHKTGLTGTKMHMSAPKTNIINAAKNNINLPNISSYSNKTNLNSLKMHYNPPKIPMNTKKISTTIQMRHKVESQKSNKNQQKQNILTSKPSLQISKEFNFKMNVSAQQAHQLINKHLHDQNFIILDVRTNSQYFSQRLEGSIHYPLSDLQNKLQTLDKNKIYFVYCRSGARSSTAAGIMRRNGFNSVINMVGGISNWVDYNYPTIHGQAHNINIQNSNKSLVKNHKISAKPNINAHEAYNIIQQNSNNLDFVLLDVRSYLQHSSQKIQNSINISVSDLQDKLQQLDKNKFYLIYCRSGARSSRAAEILRLNNFLNVTNMIGGIGSWSDNHYPTVGAQIFHKKLQPNKTILKANIGAQQACQLIKQNANNKNFVILDVRSPAEHSSEKISNSINIPVSDIEFKLKNLEKSNIFLVYCRSGTRSSNASNILRANGFQHVINMSGGISSWMGCGLPVL